MRSGGSLADVVSAVFTFLALGQAGSVTMRAEYMHRAASTAYDISVIPDRGLA